MSSTSGTEMSKASLSVSNRRPAEGERDHPAAASAPWLTMNASAANSANASSIKQQPGDVDRKLGEPEQGQDQRHAAEAPGRIMPGLNSSIPSRIRPRS